jgi:hypothetical protein
MTLQNLLSSRKDAGCAMVRPKNRTTEPPVMQQRGNSFLFLANLQRGNSFQIHGPIPLQAKPAGIEQRHLKERVLSERRASPSSWGPAMVFLGPAPKSPPRNPNPRGSWTRHDKRWRKRPSAQETGRRARGEQEPGRGELTGRVKRGKASIRGPPVPGATDPTAIWAGWVPSLSPWSDLLSEAGECV